MINDNFNRYNLIRFLLFNGLNVATHLWFVFALIYVYLLAPILIKGYKKNSKSCFTLSIVTLVLVYVFTFFFHNNIDINIRYMITRNWLFEGIPAFLIEVYLNENEDRIKNYINGIKKIKLVMFVLVIFVLITLDTYLSTLTNVYFEFYLLCPLLVIVLISLAFAYPKNRIGELMLNTFGNKCSTIIYMFHPLVLLILYKLFHRFLPNQNCYFSSLLLTIFVTLLISFLYDKSKHFLKIKD